MWAAKGALSSTLEESQDEDSVLGTCSGPCSDAVRLGKVVENLRWLSGLNALLEGVAAGLDLIVLILLVMMLAGVPCFRCRHASGMRQANQSHFCRGQLVFMPGIDGLRLQLDADEQDRLRAAPPSDEILDQLKNRIEFRKPQNVVDVSVSGTRCADVPEDIIKRASGWLVEREPLIVSQVEKRALAEGLSPAGRARLFAEECWRLGYDVRSFDLTHIDFIGTDSAKVKELRLKCHLASSSARSCFPLPEYRSFRSKDAVLLNLEDGRCRPLPV